MENKKIYVYVKTIQEIPFLQPTFGTIIFLDISLTAMVPNPAQGLIVRLRFLRKMLFQTNYWPQIGECYLL